MVKTFSIVGFFALVITLAFGAQFVLGAIDVPTRSGTFKNHTFFSATTTSAISTADGSGNGGLVITGAKKVTMYFTHGGAATTSTSGATFSIQTTKGDGIWNTFNKLIGPDVSSTATSTYAIQGATSTAVVALDLSDDTFYAIRCHSAEFAGALATDGEQTCVASVEN